MALDKLCHIFLGDKEAVLEQAEEWSLHGVDVSDGVQTVSDPREQAVQTYTVLV